MEDFDQSTNQHISDKPRNVLLRQLLVWLMVLSIGPLILSSYLHYNEAKELILTETRQRLQQTADYTRKSIKERLKSHADHSVSSSTEQDRHNRNYLMTIAEELMEVSATENIKQYIIDERGVVLSSSYPEPGILDKFPADKDLLIQAGSTTDAKRKMVSYLKGDGSQVLANVQPINLGEGENWHLVTEYHQDIQLSKATWFGQLLILELVILSLLITASAWWVARRLTKPIKLLVNAVNDFSDGKPINLNHHRVNNELDELIGYVS